MIQIDKKLNVRFTAELIFRFLLTVLLLVTPMLTVFASEDYNTDETGTLKVIVKAAAPEEGKEEEPVSGVELRAVPVFQFRKQENGEYVFVLLEEFKDAGIDAEEFSEVMTASRSNQIAALLNNYIEENAEKFKSDSLTAITGSKGIADFGSLPIHGIYLAYQSGANAAASEYTSISPFLVQIPYYNEGEGWIYDVETMPKTMDKNEKHENPPKPPEKDKPPVKKGGGGKIKTGDEASYRLWAIVLFSSAILLIVVGKLRKRDELKEDTSGDSDDNSRSGG